MCTALSALKTMTAEGIIQFQTNMRANMTQNEMVLGHLKREGSITPLVALSLYGVYRLSARINDLREEGHDIETERIDLPHLKHCARYKLIKAVQLEMAI